MIGADDIIYKNRYVWDNNKNELNQRKHKLRIDKEIEEMKNHPIDYSDIPKKIMMVK